MIEIWPAILLSGVTFAAAQYHGLFTSGPSLADIAAATSTMLCARRLPLRFWRTRGACSTPSATTSPAR